MKITRFQEAECQMAEWEQYGDNGGIRNFCQGFSKTIESVAHSLTVDQLRDEIDAFAAHLCCLSRDDFAYILDTFPVLKKKEMKAFGEFMSKRKCLEEYDRIGKILDT